MMTVDDPMAFSFTLAKRSPLRRNGRSAGCVIETTDGNYGWGATTLAVNASDPADPHVRASAVHAEIQAICHVASNGWDTTFATAYVSWFPCVTCARALALAAISRLHVGMEFPANEDEYGFSGVQDVLRQYEIELIRHDQ